MSELGPKATPVWGTVVRSDPIIVDAPADNSTAGVSDTINASAIKYASSRLRVTPRIRGGVVDSDVTMASRRYGSRSFNPRVTRDELADPHDRRITAEQRQYDLMRVQRDYPDRPSTYGKRSGTMVGGIDAIKGSVVTSRPMGVALPPSSHKVSTGYSVYKTTGFMA